VIGPDPEIGLKFVTAIWQETIDTQNVDADIILAPIPLVQLIWRSFRVNSLYLFVGQTHRQASNLLMIWLK